MQQLEQRFYSRSEIAEVLGVNIKDSKHFKRNVENKLNKWGYGYHYETKGVTILKCPTTAEERLAEILIRQYNIDVQINPYAFACFITAFSDIERFASMPWGERATAFYDYSGVSMDERTLRNWCSKLMSQNIVVKCRDGTYWKTDIIGDKRKLRTQVSAEEARPYFARRAALVEAGTEKNLHNGLSFKEARGTAWKEAYETLWTEYKCCYYICKTFSFSAFTENEREILLEVYELVREIADKRQKIFVKPN